MGNLYFIRHPAVEQIPGQLPRCWPLSEKGKQQALALSKQPWWSEVTKIYSSEEPKAHITAQIVREVHPQLLFEKFGSLNEVTRPNDYVSSALYLERLDQFFKYQDVPVSIGWETANEALDRFLSTVNKEVFHQEIVGNIALISHGLVLTLYRSFLLNQQATLDDWKLLSMGCWARVDFSTGQLTQDWTKL